MKITDHNGRAAAAYLAAGFHALCSLRLSILLFFIAQQPYFKFSGRKTEVDKGGREVRQVFSCLFISTVG
jgi:hypothetical protein